MSQDLPHDADAERSAIGCCVLSPELASDLKTEWFYDMRLGTLCSVIQHASQRGPVDKGIIWSEAKGFVQNAMALIDECEDMTPSSATFQHWRKILIETYNRRKAIQAAQTFLGKAFEANGEFPALVVELERGLEREHHSDFVVSDGIGCAEILLEHLQRRFDTQGQRSGLVTGYHKFDNMTDGLQFGEQTIIASRPSVGKTAIAVNIVQKICVLDKIPTLIVSLEMSTASLLRRLLSCAQRVAMWTLRDGTFSQADFQNFTVFNNTLKNVPLYIVDAVAGMDASEYSSVVRRHVKKHGIRFVVTDYLQKLKSCARHEKKTYEVAEVSGVIRGLAVRTKAAFLTLAQLNRESEKEKGRFPRISDLADSGQIERDADTIALLHRPRDENKKNEAVLYIGKQRDGDTGPVRLDFDGKYCMFTNPIV